MNANEYAELSLSELADAADAMAWELRTAKGRTPEERTALAEQCAMLLIGMARTIKPSRAVPHKPENHLRPEAMVAVFAAWAKEQCRHARFHTLRRAAEFALGKNAAAFFHERKQWDLQDDVAVDMLCGSDEAMLSALQAIDDQRRRSAPK